MPSVPVPLDEESRLATLHALQILDTGAEPEFDALAQAAALACGTPLALITLVDSKRQWFKANVGLPDLIETPRDASFCAHVILDSQVMEVPDAAADGRFADNPLVQGAPDIRFYAGAPISLSDGTRVGALCVMDRQPRQLEANQRAILLHLSKAVGRALETRRSELAYHTQQTRLSDVLKRQRQQYEATPAMLYSISAEARFLSASDLFLSKMGYTREEVIGRAPSSFMTAESARRAREVVFPEFLRTGVSDKVQYQYVKKSGEVMDVLISAVLVRDSAGKPLHSLTSVEDITQRLMAENQLKSERSHLANIVKGTNAGTWEHDLTTGSDRINDIYARMLGYTMPEMEARLGANFFNILHPEDREQVGLRWDAHLQGVTPEYEAEFRAMHREGHWVWILSRGRVGERDADGRALNISGIHLDISSRRNAVDMATRAMRDLQNTLDALPSLVAYWDRDLRYRFANRAYGERYQVRPDSLPGRHISEFLSPDLYAKNQPFIRAAMAGQEQSFEREIAGMDGTRNAMVRYVPDWDGGEVQGIYVFIFDITEIKQAQGALAKEREQLRNILEGTHAGTWQFNLQTLEAVINERWAEISGHTLDDFRSLNLNAWHGLCHPDDRAQIIQSMQAHLHGKSENYASQYRIRHRDGHWIWVQDRGKISSYTADGKPEWVSGTHLDVHDKVSAEIQLHEQLQFVEVLLEATPTAIYLMDIHGRYLRFNKAFESLFGIDRVLWMGKTAVELLGDEAGHQMQLRDEALFANGEFQTYESTFTNRLTGQQREGLYYKAPLRDAQGRITALVGTIQDITERNQVARKLETAIAEVQAATEAKGRFLANMSHELRTPMNAVLGMLKLLQTTELSDRQLDYANKTESAARSLLGLLNDILDFSKLDAGKMELDPHPFRLDTLMRDLAVVLSSTVGGKNVEVLFDIDASLPEVVEGDSMRLRQVLINLGSNAVKFTQNGQVVVALRPAPGQVPGETLAIEFSVTDSGIGIAPENLARIFSGFSQAEASTTRRFGGTGLGLAISQRLVEMMGGEIRVESEPGRGSRFSFVVGIFVPLSIPEELKVLKPRSDVARRVLVIDDNAISRDLIARVCRSWGWPTETVDSGEAALAVISGHLSSGQGFPFDVVYVDWHMPGLDGWETVARLRTLALEAGSFKPHLVMVTANGRESLSQRTTDEQAMLDGFLVKPVTASMLLDAVVSARPEHLGLRSRKRSSRRQLAGMNILVVEDNLINQQVAEELLNSEGARVSLAADGRQGVNAVLQATVPYDAVLMDIQMPVLDGYEATREIRAMPGMAHLVIIGLTANAMESDREACLHAGMNEHMGKPFELAQLVSMLIRLTGRQAEAAQTGPLPADAESVGSPETPIAEDQVLDLPGALRRLAGMQDLYIRAASEFRKVLDGMERTLGPLIQQSDLAGAAAQLHSYKGTASTLGFVRLSKRLAQLEALCKARAGMDDIGSHLQELWPEVTLASSALRQALAGLGVSDSAGDQAPATAVEIRELVLSDAARAALGSLMPRLQTSDLGVLEQFAIVRPQLQELPVQIFEQLEVSLQDLDLESALNLCRKLLA